MTDLETLLLLQLRDAGLPEPKLEYQFHPKRKFRADMCWSEYLVIAEINGMTHVASRGHTSWAGLHRDFEKQNQAQLMGYRYFEFDREMIEDGTALDIIRKAMEAG